MFLLLTLVTVVAAKTEGPKAKENAGLNAERSVTASATRDNEDKVESTDNPSEKDGDLNDSLNTLQEVQNKVKNKEAKDAIGLAEDAVHESESTIEASFKAMSGRPGFLKFIMGPDYKNAGQIRSEVVKLEAQINQLTREKSRASTADQVAIDASIKSLQSDLTGIETKLNSALQGVSLFGWLARILTGFSAVTPTPSPTPVSTSSPTASPSATP